MIVLYPRCVTNSRDERNRRIGARVRAARERLRPPRSQQWVVRGLAERGATHAQEWLSKIERGERTLLAPDAQALGEVLGASAGELLGDERVALDAFRRLLPVWEELTAEEQEALLGGFELQLKAITEGRRLALGASRREPGAGPRADRASYAAGTPDAGAPESDAPEAGAAAPPR